MIFTRLSRSLATKYRSVRKFSSNHQYNDLLLNLLVCPVSKGELYYDEDVNALISLSGHLAYQIPPNGVINLMPRGPHIASIAVEEEE